MLFFFFDAYENCREKNKNEFGDSYSVNFQHIIYQKQESFH